MCSNFQFFDISFPLKEQLFLQYVSFRAEYILYLQLYKKSRCSECLQPFDELIKNK